MIETLPLSAKVAEPAPVDPYEAALRRVVAGLDVEALLRQYRENDSVLVLPDFLPPALVKEMTAESRRLKPGLRRTHLPLVRKGGAISHFQIREAAPALSSLRRSEALLDLFQRIAGPELERRLDDDPHAQALYVYDRWRDHVGWHFDDCGCEKEASFTVILGLVDQSSSKLEFELFHDQPQRRRVLSLATRPGTLAFFCGSRAHHRVTRLGLGEERISFSWVYVKRGFHPKGFDKLWQTGINTFLYFGPRHLLQQR
jgi:hypothetical protein